MNHKAPSGPAVIARGVAMLGAVKLVTAPRGGDPPDRIAGRVGEPQRAVGSGRDARGFWSVKFEMLSSVKLVTVPSVVIRPIELLPVLVNHNAPSGPAVIAHGLETPMPVYVTSVPSVLIRPIESPR